MVPLNTAAKLGLTLGYDVPLGRVGFAKQDLRVRVQGRNVNVGSTRFAFSVCVGIDLLDQ